MAYAQWSGASRSIRTSNGYTVPPHYDSMIGKLIS